MPNGDDIPLETDTEDGEEEETYQWIAFSECAVCNALVGLYDIPPPRPHPYCECQVIRLGRGAPDLVQCQTYWDFEHVRNEYSGPDPLHPHVEMFYDVFVYCWDGGIYEYQEYEIDYDPSTFGTATVDELRQVAEDMARYNCRASHDCLGVS